MGLRWWRRGLETMVVAVASGQLLVPPSRMVTRTTDPLTGTVNPDLRKAFALDDFPTFMGVAEDDEEPSDDVLAQMRWYIVPETGVVLLNPLVPLEYIYRHQHNAVVGSIWATHHNEFAKLVAAHAPGSRVLEIGGGHGYLAAKLLFSDAVAHWTMVDPNPISTFAIPNLEIIRAYVEDVGALDRPIDCVVHSHTLEHMYDPGRFFDIIRGLLKPGQLHIFSMPNLFALVSDGQPSLHFEHTILLREEHVTWLLRSRGFDVVEVAHFGGKHSIFYVTRVAAKLPPETAPPNFYAETRHAFQRWHESIAADAAEFAAKLSPDTSRNFVYAAHVSTQYLLAAGLPAGDFAAILDNNQDKIGKRLYGHGLRVKAPDAIRDVDRPVVVLRTGVYDDEIAAQLTKINPAVTLLRSANRTGGAPQGRQHHGHHDHRAGGPPRRLRGS